MSFLAQFSQEFSPSILKSLKESKRHILPQRVIYHASAFMLHLPLNKFQLHSMKLFIRALSFFQMRSLQKEKVNCSFSEIYLKRIKTKGRFEDGDSLEIQVFFIKDLWKSEVKKIQGQNSFLIELGKHKFYNEGLFYKNVSLNFIW